MRLKKRGFKKRGQAAIFIILAALILFGGIYFFSAQIALTERKTKVPQEFEPVVVLVDECIRQKAEEGLETIGMTGGYIDLPEEVLFNPRSHIPAPPNAGIKIPYWWYENGKGELMPSESGIKAQLEKFIKSNATECVDNFKALESQFEVTPKSEMSVKVSFNEENVGVDVDYEIEAYSKLKDQKITIKNFYYDSRVRFKRVFELAGKIMERENKDFFFEEKTIDLISNNVEYDNSDPASAIPVTFMAFPDCLRRKWRVSDVRERIQKLLVTNIPFIKLPEADISLNTYVPNPCLDPRFSNNDLCKLEQGQTHSNTYEDSYFKNNFLWEINTDPASEDKYKNMEVSFRYDNEPLQMEVRPRDGEYLKSNLQKGAGLLKLLCTNVWHFTYDVAYPVRVSILDKPSPGNKRYSFNFAFKVAMRRNNEATDRQSSGASPLEEIGRMDSEDYCANNLQKEGSYTTIRAFDSNNWRLEDVEIEYTCGGFSCNMGKTELNTNQDLAILQKRFPMCTSGKLTASKKGYKEGTDFFVTDHTPNLRVVNLDALKEFGKIEGDVATGYKVYKVKLLRPLASDNMQLMDSTKGEFTFSSAKEMDNDEKATIVIEEKIPPDAEGNPEPHTAIGSYPPETGEASVGGELLSANSPITLFRDYDKTYKATVYLSDKTGENVRGMYESDWTPKKEDVISKNIIEFYVIEFTPNENLDEEIQEEEMAFFQSEIAFFSEELNKQGKQPQFRE